MISCIKYMVQRSAFSVHIARHTDVHNDDGESYVVICHVGVRSGYAKYDLVSYVNWLHTQHSIFNMWIELENGEHINIHVDPTTKLITPESISIINQHTLRHKSRKPKMSTDNQVKPITPDDIRAIQESGVLIPPFVIKAVNKLLIDNTTVTGRSITLKYKEVKKAIEEQMVADGHLGTIKVDDRWMDFEPYYRKFGWSVEYDKPGYNESYDAFYSFNMK